MEPMLISEVLSAVNGKLICGNLDIKIMSVSINSKDIEKGSLFVPIVGEKVDGHNYINDATKNGAVAAFTQNCKQANDNNCTMIYVEDTKKALQDLAIHYRKKFNIPVVGVTGSVGKTTTREMIAAAISSRKSVMKTKKNHNSQLGLPLTVFQLKKKHDVAVMEMGVSQFGEMDRLSEIALVNKAVITNIGVSHIENLHSKENIRSEKLKITNNFDKDSVLFLNGNDELLRDLKNTLNQKIIYFGFEDFCDYKAKDIEMDGEKTTFTLIAPKCTEKITISTLGVHNVVNSLAAIAVAFDMGLTIDEIKKGLESYVAPTMRQQILKLDKITVINDSYNASPDSVRSAISVLKDIKNNGRSIAVLGDILELGDYAKREHFNLGKYVCENNIDILITVGKNAEEIANGAKSLQNDIAIKSFYSNDDAIKYLLNIINKDDIVLVKGSRGMHMEKIVDKLIKNYKKNN